MQGGGAKCPGQAGGDLQQCVAKLKDVCPSVVSWTISQKMLHAFAAKKHRFVIRLSHSLSLYTTSFDVIQMTQCVSIGNLPHPEL